MGDFFEYFSRWCSDYGYPVLFAGVLLENAGIPVPGETAVLAAGFLASPGGGGVLWLGWVIPLVFMAAVIGDNCGFWVGHRWARPRLLAGKRFLFLTPKTLHVAESYFERYGLWTIFVARFVTGLRVIGAMAAGTAGMNWPRFLFANCAGALVWAASISALGYFFGHSWKILENILGGGGALLLGVVIILAIAFYVRQSRAQKWSTESKSAETKKD